MATPADSKLYEKAMKKYKDMKTSAYRSGLIVKYYKNLFTQKYGINKKPYIGTKTKKLTKAIKRVSNLY
jgi:hypothetical protein